MLRHIAKNLVANGYASKCEIQISYAIGVARPISVYIDTFGTNKKSEDEILDIKEAITIVIKIPIVSNQSKPFKKKKVFIPKAINSIRIMGSPKDSINIFSIVFFFIFINSLDPYSFLDFNTSLSLRPFKLIIRHPFNLMNK